MIAGGVRDNALRSDFLGEREQRIESASNLEGASFLKTLGLEEDFAPGNVIDRLEQVVSRRGMNFEAFFIRGV